MVMLSLSMVNQPLDNPIVQGVLIAIIPIALLAVIYSIRDRLWTAWRNLKNINTRFGKVASLEQDIGEMKRDIAAIRNDIDTVVPLRINVARNDVKRVVQDLKSFINESSKEYYIIHDRYKEAECSDCQKVNERFLKLKEKAEALVAALDREPEK